MSLDKAIKYGKEKRKPYCRAKAVAVGCRNHGWCSYCRGNRLHKFRDKHPRDINTDSQAQVEQYDDISG